ncbi:MAG: serine/threonine protein kinase [Planctomycetes bacterium]|nr:serine/threonine protein kinase [Planctomycetota bacterium]
MAENQPALPAPNPGTSAKLDPMVGRRLGSYEIISRVARGGMGVVYRARHVYIDKIVAIKVLDPALAARKDLISRFRTEAQSLAKVEHENVVKVNDIVDIEGLHFIVMDFVEGINLRTAMKERGPMRPKELLSVARQTADALQFAHRQGILHRDIKPENIIMSSRGVCKLTDFGLAGDLRLISEGHDGQMNFGTPAYAAPEILRKQTPDARSDIFSFGATMYHLACGDTPFGPSNAQAIALKQRQGAELLEGRRPDLPQSLCTLIQSCLAYNPAERPLDFDEILQRLPKRIIERNTPDTPTAPSGPLITTESLPPAPPSRLFPIVSGVAALAALTVVGFVVISRLTTPPPDVNRPTADGGVTRASNTPRDGVRGDDGPRDGSTNVATPPTFTAEEEAFNEAELEAGGAQRTANYARAYGAWQRFKQRFPDGTFAAQADSKLRELVIEVADMRKAAYNRAWEISDKAITASNSADALAAWEAVPAALLGSLYEGEKNELADRVETQRRRVLSLEADVISAAFEKADKHRAKGELLAELALLQKLLNGRTPAGAESVNARLEKLKTALAEAHVAASLVVEQDRDAVVLKRGQAAQKLRAGLDQVATDALHRRWPKARQGLSVLAKELTDMALRRSIESYGQDADLAARAEDALHAALDRVRKRGAATTIKAHAGFMGDDTRDPKIISRSGRITTLTQTEITLRDSDGKEQKIKLLLVAAESMKTFLRDGSLDDRMSLIAWLLASGDAGAARDEADRLLDTSGVPASVGARTEALKGCEVLGQPALRRLSYFAARAGQVDVGEFVGLFGGDGFDVDMLRLQASIERGDKPAARQYVNLTAQVADPDLVSPRTLAAAMELLTDATRADVELWIKHEPRNAQPLLRLAQLQKTESPGEYRRTAQKALEIDPSLEEAWALTK